MDRNTPCVILDCGVDWITGTNSDRKPAQHLAQKALWIMASELRNGNEKVPWSMSGYHGWKCGGVQFGDRGDSLMVRLSGPTAWWYWKDLYPLFSNVSRIDVQVTVQYERASSWVIAKHYRQAMRYFRLGKAKRTIALYRSSDGSATAYLGRRISDCFGRIYEKGKESKLDHYQNCVRYELELKHDTATRAAKLLYDAEDHQRDSVSLIADWFRDAGVRSPALEVVRLPNIRASRALSTAETRLLWMRSQVRPAVQALLAMLDREQVLEALGLTDSQPTVVDGPTWSTEKEGGESE